MKISKLHWCLLVSFGLLAICGLTAIVGQELHRRHIRESLALKLDVVHDQISVNETQKRFQALHRLAQSPTMRDATSGARVKETPDLLLFLNAYRLSMGASIIYLMDASGNVVACTPYDGEKTLTGNNYTIRPYFQKALAGEDYLYGALGLTTHERGVYFSTPVRFPERPDTFVVVAKFPLDDMDTLIEKSPDPLVLATPTGVVFCSNDRSYLFKRVFPLSDAQLAELMLSQQFPDQPLTPLPFSLDGDEFTHAGKQFLVVRRKVEVGGWQVISWNEYRVPWAWIIGYSSFFSVGYLVGCVLLYFYGKKREFQRNLEVSQQDYQAIFNASADAIFIHDIETGKVIDVNSQMCEMYKCERSDIVDQGLDQYTSGIPPYTTEDAYQHIKLAAAGEDQLFEWQARKLNGELFWVEVHLKRTELKGIPRLIAVVRDISERMEATNRLRKLSKAIEASPASVMITDSKGTIEYVNAAFSDVTGYTEDEVLGEHSRILKSGIHPESYYKDLWKTITSGGVWAGEMCNLTKDKKMFWELARIAPIFNEAGDITHFVAVKGDITELKMAEKMLRASKIEAEQAARAKSRFLANMSHEIRTPLNGILGFIDLSCRENDIPEQTKNNLELAQRAAEDLLQLINDILDTSKLENGKMLVEAISFNVRDMVAEVRDLFTAKAEEKGLSLSVAVTDEVGSLLKGDPAKIKQVLYNLIGNALKFTEHGSITLAVGRGSDTDEVIFDITDTGIGIPQGLQDHIFAPFAQADESTTRRFGGSGLGTTISRQLVELMGGRIWLKSTEGKGSQFSFSLPLLEVKPHRASPAEGADSVDFDDLAEGPSLRILMAEDVDINQRLSELWFEKTPHTLTIASNGVEALELYDNGDFDLILMDIHMPEMDGLQATREIRARDKTSGCYTPIFALTASVLKEECEDYYEAGMDDVVGKPINFNALLKKISKVKPRQQKTTVAGAPLDVIWDTTWRRLRTVVNLEEALNTWSEPRYFIEALLAFTDEHTGLMERIERAVKDKELDKATERVHVLKVASGNLSFSNVYPLAIELESKLLSVERQDLDADLAALSTAFDDTFSVLIKMKEVLNKHPELMPPLPDED